MDEFSKSFKGEVDYDAVYLSIIYDKMRRKTTLDEESKLLNLEDAVMSEEELLGQKENLDGFYNVWMETTFRLTNVKDVDEFSPKIGKRPRTSFYPPEKCEICNVNDINIYNANLWSKENMGKFTIESYMCKMCYDEKCSKKMKQQDFDQKYEEVREYNHYFSNIKLRQKYLNEAFLPQFHVTEKEKEKLLTPSVVQPAQVKKGFFPWSKKTATEEEAVEVKAFNPKEAVHYYYSDYLPDVDDDYNRFLRNKQRASTMTRINAISVYGSMEFKPTLYYKLMTYRFEDIREWFAQKIFILRQTSGSHDHDVHQFLDTLSHQTINQAFYGLIDLKISADAFSASDGIRSTGIRLGSTGIRLGSVGPRSVGPRSTFSMREDEEAFANIYKKPARFGSVVRGKGGRKKTKKTKKKKSRKIYKLNDGRV